MKRPNKKPEVGQVLYSLNVGNAARNCEQKLRPVTVTKVGRKYFTCKHSIHQNDYWDYQYHIDGWYEKSEYMANSCLYENPQQWEDEKECAELLKMIKDEFSFGFRSRGGDSLSLYSLRKIAEIINNSGE